MKIECPFCRYITKIKKADFGAQIQCPRCEKYFRAIEKYHDQNIICRIAGAVAFIIGMLSLGGGNSVLTAILLLGGLALATRK